MHEAGIAASILGIAEREAQGKALRSVHVRVGDFSGVVPDALEFAFEAMKADTLASHARLEIERVPITAWCSSCQQESQPVSNLILWCERCHSPLVIHGGQELDVAYIEVED
jgi:hydrogenase nickel incorporation protein HypA/HybF